MTNLYTDTNTKLTEVFTTLVDKEWGQEEILVANDLYTIKAMHVKPGYSLSFHLHREKVESFVLIKGKLIVDLVSTKTTDQTEVLLEKPFDTLTLENMVIHSFHCPDGQEEETIVMECSTYDDPSDSYRFVKSHKR